MHSEKRVIVGSFPQSVLSSTETEGRWDVETLDQYSGIHGVSATGRIVNYTSFLAKFLVHLYSEGPGKIYN